MDNQVKKIKQYSIELKCVVPATINYIVYAYSAEEAELLVKNTLIEPKKVNYNFNQKLLKSIKIFDYPIKLLKLMKTYY